MSHINVCPPIQKCGHAHKSLPAPSGPAYTSQPFCIVQNENWELECGSGHEEPMRAAFSFASVWFKAKSRHEWLPAFSKTKLCAGTGVGVGPSGTGGAGEGAEQHANCLPSSAGQQLLLPVRPNATQPGFAAHVRGGAVQHASCMPSSAGQQLLSPVRPTSTQPGFAAHVGEADTKSACKARITQRVCSRTMAKQLTF